jgi:hypothetical protein
MVSQLGAVSVLLALTAQTFAAIDLTPTPSTRELEGATFPELIFYDGKTRVSYEPPSGWHYTGTSSQLKLTPPGLSQAEGMITTIPAVTARQTNDGESSQRRRAALRLLSAAAEQVEVLSEGQGAVQINGRQTFELTVQYVLNGDRFSCVVTFLDLPDSCLIFWITGKTAEFKPLSKLFQKSLCSLQWLPEK